MSPRAKRGGPNQPGSPRSARGDGTSALAAQPIEFVGSWPDPSTPLDPPLPEVAFVGRSNVGKSSLLNALVGRKGLARVSGTPGKTRLMNVFRLPTFYLVDLPGYGYAKVSKVLREQWGELIEEYLTRCEDLIGMVLLLDSRRDPTAQDMELVAWLTERQLPVLVAVTKADKLTRDAQNRKVRKTEEELGASALAFSTVTGLGRIELMESIRQLVKDHKTQNKGLIQ
jgi:GTP-binding protein